MGQELGRQFSAEIRKSNDSLIADAEASKGIKRDAVMAKVRTYQVYMDKYAENLVEELRGIADGANILYEEALLMQLRFEIVGYQGVQNDGCTSFAISGERTANGRVLTGQNADINDYLEKTLRIIHFSPDDGPDILMPTYYSAMIGWIGINSDGLGCFGNAVVCPGWREGFPRYPLLRKILEKSSVKDAIKFTNEVQRASSINVVITDATGDMKDVETSINRNSVLEPTHGVLAHANHYLDPELQKTDLLLPTTCDSPLRYGQMFNRLLSISSDRESVTVDGCEEILRDHTNWPHSICRHIDENPRYIGKRIKTIMSIVASPEERFFEASWGNPCENSFHRYSI